GARIETRPRQADPHADRESPLAQGRGLKHDLVPPAHAGERASPLAQGRGLKRGVPVGLNSSAASPLAQGRGLKHASGKGVSQLVWIAPRAGARIETSSLSIF